MLPLWASQQWPALKVEGSTSYTCQGYDLSPLFTLYRSHSLLASTINPPTTTLYCTHTHTHPISSFLRPLNDPLSPLQSLELGFTEWFINFPSQFYFILFSFFFLRAITNVLSSYFGPGRHPKTKLLLALRPGKIALQLPRHGLWILFCCTPRRYIRTSCLTGRDVFLLRLLCLKHRDDNVFTSM